MNIRMYQAFKTRAAEIADHAHNPRGAPGEFVQRLDEMELQCEWGTVFALHDCKRGWLEEARC